MTNKVTCFAENGYILYQIILSLYQPYERDGSYDIAQALGDPHIRSPGLNGRNSFSRDAFRVRGDVYVYRRRR